MPILDFLYKPKNELEKGGRAVAPIQADANEPERTCPNCHKAIPLSRIWANNHTCSCGYHFRMSARQRITFITDKGTFSEMFKNVTSGDPLSFDGYKQKLETVRAASNEEEAVICGTAEIGGTKCMLFVMEPNFMMGSMGSVCGEKVTRLAEKAYKEKLPLVIFTCSGGARMQEGIISLMQMAKTSAAFAKLNENGLYIYCIICFLQYDRII